MKKILLTLGAITSIIAPIASTIACGKDYKKNYTWANSVRTDAEIITDLTEAVNHSIAVSASLSFGADRAENVGVGGNVKKDVAIEYWNKPEGSTFRLAAIVTAIGHNIWGSAVAGMPGAGDQVIRAIIFGVMYDLSQKDSDFANKSEDERKKIASSRLNEYKVELVNNINKFISDNHVLESLQKFDGFLTWLTDSANNYENLKTVLIGGMINENVIQGIQDELNKPTDSMGLITPVKTDIVIINPTP